MVEEEQGTLARLFTTPTDPSIILNGKVLAAFVSLAVQVTVLLVFGRLVLRIDWGAIGSLFLAGAGIVLLAGTTGLFLVSLLKDTRQSGIIFGGVLTMTGMVGLIPVFTAGVPNQSTLVQTAALLVPHGCARGWMRCCCRPSSCWRIRSFSLRWRSGASASGRAGGGSAKSDSQPAPTITPIFQCVRQAASSGPSSAPPLVGHCRWMDEGAGAAHEA